MSVTVITKRVFSMKRYDKLIPLFQKLRDHAKKQKGFVNRKTFSSLTNPGEFISISKWESEDYWKKWMKKKVPRQVQGKIDSLIGEKTIYDIYRPEEY